jgi:hypothetical protein
MDSASWFALVAAITAGFSAWTSWRYGNKQLSEARHERTARATADEQRWIRDQNLVDMKKFLGASFDGAIRPYFERRAADPSLDRIPYEKAWATARRTKLQALSGFRISAPRVVQAAWELHRFEEDLHRRVFADDPPSRELLEEEKREHQRLRDEYVRSCRQVLGIPEGGPRVRSELGASGEVKAFPGSE